jgi:hypothetical protein
MTSTMTDLDRTKNNLDVKLMAIGKKIKEVVTYHQLNADNRLVAQIMILEDDTMIDVSDPVWFIVTDLDNLKKYSQFSIHTCVVSTPVVPVSTPVDPVDQGKVCS